MATAPATLETVQVKRTFTAPREKVFEAWTNPKLMMRWFTRPPSAPPAKIIEADVRTGGHFQVEVVEGKLYRGSGTYVEVRPPEKLVFTWLWDHHDFTDSLVTVEFRALGGSNFTEVTLTHERLPKAECEAHRKGWEECFDGLERVLRGEEF